INFDPVDCHIICFPHMLNTCSKHVVQEYTKADFSAVGLHWARSYYTWMGRTHAYAISMHKSIFFVDLTIHLTWIDEHWSSSEADNVRRMAKALLSCSTFPTLFCITMDYLPIQASLVPCEHVFSSSGETNTKCCNHISPILMEALQMLKFFLKKDHLDFTKGWATSQKEMLMDVDDED
ncbi:hypothetical protein PAXINDRAFT_56100, partial [Paxillus involutus ATCC 200175]